jgi:hypothetical protein
LETLTDSLTDTLSERVDKLVQAGKVPLGWGSPLLSVTPTWIAIRQLAVQFEALEHAVREVALEVQKLSAHQEVLEEAARARLPGRTRSSR